MEAVIEHTGRCLCHPRFKRFAKRILVGNRVEKVDDCCDASSSRRFTSTCEIVTARVCAYLERHVNMRVDDARKNQKPCRIHHFPRFSPNRRVARDGCDRLAMNV